MIDLKDLGELYNFLLGLDMIIDIEVLKYKG